MSVAELQELEAVKLLVAKGQQTGTLTFAEVATALSEDPVAPLRPLLAGSGAPAPVEAGMGSLADHAVPSLDKADVDDHARAVLRDLASAATQRVV